MIDLDELERKARAATQGPWYYAEQGACSAVETEEGAQVAVLPYEKDECAVAAPVIANAFYIAAASPDVVLELIAEVRRLREVEAERDAVHRRADALVQSTLEAEGILHRMIADQRQRVAELEQERDRYMADAVGYAASREQAEQTAAALRAVLEQYGEHKELCGALSGVDAPGPCDCGLAAALTPKADA